MILADGSLKALLSTFIREPDESMVNPASIDIRIGKRLLQENPGNIWVSHALEDQPYTLTPGELILVETYEHITVPNGYTMQLFLKSSMARQGFNHALAFWVDPGWSGVLTMEVSNDLRYGHLSVYYGMRFAQMVIQKLDHPAERPYQGKYQHATGVEASKP
jgi:dCTP deaminase